MVLMWLGESATTVLAWHTLERQDEWEVTASRVEVVLSLSQSTWGQIVIVINCVCQGEWESVRVCVRLRVCAHVCTKRERKRFNVVYLNRDAEKRN